LRDLPAPINEKRKTAEEEHQPALHWHQTPQSQ
jgi:hypothetical protein